MTPFWIRILKNVYISLKYVSSSLIWTATNWEPKQHSCFTPTVSTMHTPIENNRAFIRYDTCNQTDEQNNRQVCSSCTSPIKRWHTENTETIDQRARCILWYSQRSHGINPMLEAIFAGNNDFWPLVYYFSCISLGLAITDLALVVCSSCTTAHICGDGPLAPLLNTK